MTFKIGNQDISYWGLRLPPENQAFEGLMTLNSQGNY